MVLRNILSTIIPYLVDFKNDYKKLFVLVHDAQHHEQFEDQA
jgi:hypothetical protein